MRGRHVCMLLLTLLLLAVFPTTVCMASKPELQIVDLRGGIGLTLRIRNVGDTDATGVGYHLIHGDGFFLRSKKWKTSLPDIPAGDTITVKTRFIRFGIGLGIFTKMPWINLTVYAQNSENITRVLLARTCGAFVILQNSGGSTASYCFADSVS